MLRKNANSGFSLIELVVALAVLSFLLMLGMPSLSATIQSSRIRAAVSSFNSGVQLARAQAVSRNLQVDFVPGDGNGNLSPAWSVQLPGSPSPEVIEVKPVQEGASQRLQVANANGIARVSFNGLGQATFRDSSGAAIAINPAIFSFTGAEGSGACVGSGGSLRCLDVRVTPGGQIRLCDPQAEAGDSRVC